MDRENFKIHVQIVTIIFHCSLIQVDSAYVARRHEQLLGLLALVLEVVEHGVGVRHIERVRTGVLDYATSLNDRKYNKWLREL